MAHGVEIHCFEIDLTLPHEPHAFAKRIKKKFPVNILINNAGAEGSVPLEKATPAYIDNILMLNIRALSLLTYHFIPTLKKHNPAYILNVSSLSAFCPLPYKTVYPASKNFICSFSQSLQIELMKTSIQVTVLAPGTMCTNPTVTQNASRHGWLGKATILAPEYTAKQAIRGLLQGKAMIVPGFMNKVTYWLMKILPKRIKMFLSYRIFSKDITPQQEPDPTNPEEIKTLLGQSEVSVENEIGLH